VLQIRSILFNFTFYVVSAAILVGFSPLLLMSRSLNVTAMHLWSRLTMWLLRIITGMKYELRGKLPEGAVLIASKHQSMWDTIIYTAILHDPAMVLKRELLWVPFYGWYSLKTRMIAIDRGAGASAIRRLITQARAAIALNRAIVIFPEGTRSSPGAKLDYKPGIAALYRQLGVPCVPVALNSGLYWPRRKFWRKPGTIVLEFLDPIPPGLSREAFMTELETRIETASMRLYAEATGQG
jgi:1-acyl-sn-glycerol-3-phosphate acyltransferase